MTAADRARAGWDSAPGTGLSRPAAAIVTLIVGGMLAGILDRMADRLAGEGAGRADDQP